MDTIKVLIDHESEELISKDRKLEHLRYSIVNASACIPARAAKNGAKYKRFLGQQAYSFAAIPEFFPPKEDKFDVVIDGQKVLQD